jgi:hypothetical protein
MALPKDNPNAATDAVAAEIKKMGPKDLAALPDLDGADLQLIGTLIQYFSFMDLNLRRALETFHAEKMLPREYAKLWPDSLPDSKLTEALGVIVKSMDPAKEKIEESLIWIQVIDSTRLKQIWSVTSRVSATTGTMRMCSLARATGTRRRCWGPS